MNFRGTVLNPAYQEISTAEDVERVAFLAKRLPRNPERQTVLKGNRLTKTLQLKSKDCQTGIKSKIHLLYIRDVL